MFILQGSGPLGSGPTGPGSGYSVMPFCIGVPEMNNNIWCFQNIRLNIWGLGKK